MTITVQDGFGGMSSGDDVSGRTPDTTNTPSGTWRDSGADDVESDGAGAIQCADNSSDAWIDGGSVDVAVSVEFNAGGADNRGSVIARSSDAQKDDCYVLNWRTGANQIFISRWINGSSTDLGSPISYSMDDATTYKYEIRVNGTTIQAFVNDSQIGSDQTDASIDGTTEGGTFAGFGHRLHSDSNARFDNFIVDDLGASGTTINCNAGAVVVTGLAASVSAGRTINCSAGAVSVSGLAANVSAGTTINATSGAVSISGLQATIDTSGATVVDCTAGAVTATGLQANISAGRTIACTKGAVAVTVHQAQILQGTSINCTVGNTAVSSHAVSVSAGIDIDCTTAIVVVAGYQAFIITSQTAKGTVTASISASKPGVSITAAKPGITIQ